MVQDEDDRRVERDVFQTGNFDALEINPQRDFQKGNYDATASKTSSDYNNGSSKLIRCCKSFNPIDCVNSRFE